MNIAVKDLLDDWFSRLRESQFAHYEAAKAYERLNFFLGVPVVALSTLVGTTVFATLGQSLSPIVQICVGLVSVAAAVLAGIQTFLRFAERAEKHRSVAAGYGATRREIEEIRALGEDVSKDALAALRHRIDELAKEAPHVSKAIWMRTQKQLSPKVR